MEINPLIRERKRRFGDGNGSFTDAPPIANGKASHLEAGETAAVAAPSAPAIEVRDVTKRFQSAGGTVTALDGISFTAEAGEFVCLVGPSGCGKSTLCHMIAGLQMPDSGTVSVNGAPVKGPGPSHVLMFQEAALFPWMNAVDNVAFGLTATGVPKREARDRAMDYLKMVRLARFARSQPHELSGGMRQRVALARALAVEPAVLLMDEPFSALDAQTREILHVELQRIWQETKKTIVFVTHNVTEAVTLGTRALVFTARPGRIKKAFRLELPRPRFDHDAAVVEQTNSILDVLREEIEKVEREEFDVDWRLENRRLPGDPGYTLGDGI
jgi:NitT/TauT family transport system ATP-binding protein